MFSPQECIEEALQLSKEEKIQKILLALLEQNLEMEEWIIKNNDHGNFDARVELIYRELSKLKNAEERKNFLSNLYQNGLPAEYFIQNLTKQELDKFGVYDFEEEDLNVPEEEVEKEGYISIYAKKLLRIPAHSELPKFSDQEIDKLLNLIYTNFVYDDTFNEGKFAGLAAIFAKEGLITEAIQLLLQNELAKLNQELTILSTKDLDQVITPAIRTRIFELLENLKDAELFF